MKLFQTEDGSALALKSIREIASDFLEAGTIWEL